MRKNTNKKMDSDAYVSPFSDEAEDDGDGCGADQCGTDHEAAVQLEPGARTCHRKHRKMKMQRSNAKCGKVTSYRNEDLLDFICGIKFAWYLVIFFRNEFNGVE